MIFNVFLIVPNKETRCIERKKSIFFLISKEWKKSLFLFYFFIPPGIRISSFFLEKKKKNASIHTYTYTYIHTSRENLPFFLTQTKKKEKKFHPLFLHIISFYLSGRVFLPLKKRDESTRYINMCTKKKGNLEGKRDTKIKIKKIFFFSMITFVSWPRFELIKFLDRFFYSIELKLQ